MAKPAAAPLSPSDRIARAFFFVLLALFCVSLPHQAGTDLLDPSWRMALGGFFRQGLQFGTEVVFTYGPLGFLMGNTDDGTHVPVLLAWQLFQGLLIATLVFRQGLRVPGYGRYFYFVFFFLLGVNYHDVTQQMAMALVAFELLREREPYSRGAAAGAGAILALFALVKFTNLVLALVLVASIGGLRLWRRHHVAAGWIVGSFVTGFLLGWMLCGQNSLNLVAYFRHSWEISQGYQEAMGVPAPWAALWKGVTVLALIVLYAGVHLLTAVDRAQACAMVVALGGFTYLNWKHGFVRADGHMIGFFYAMIFVATSFPALLDDRARWTWLKRGMLLSAAVLALLGVTNALPGFLRVIAAYNQDRIAATISAYTAPSRTVARYREAFERLRSTHALEKTRQIVGKASVDVLGHEQAVAILNGLNYRPRPIFQSYSVYRPKLAELNAHYYESDHAPDYVLAKLQTIDNRLVSLDDSAVLHLLPHRYDFVHLEKGFMLWKRKAGAFDPASIAPQPIASAEVPLGEMWTVGDAASEPLWATIDVRLNLLGKLRSFFYKPPQLTLHLEDAKGTKSDYRFSMPQGRAGFLLSPVVEDMLSYMRFSSPSPERIVRTVGISAARQDADCFSPTVRITLHKVPRANAGADFFRENAKDFFTSFKAVPVSYESRAPLSSEYIDGEPVTVFHAPSEMIVPMRDGVTEFAGSFGFISGAYNGGFTDGAIFSVTWHVDGAEIPLFERTLTPVQTPGDRGLQRFSVKLPARSGGHLKLRISPGKAGDYSWDWTAWGGLEFR